MGKPYRFAAIYLGILIAFSIWVLLDAFVIRRRMASVENTALVVPASEEILVTEDRWYGKGIHVTLSESRYADTTIYLADVELADIRFMQTALAENTFGRNIRETVADMALEHHAILAINGDYYGSRRSGYVIRNGVLYRNSVSSETQEDLCIWPDGNMSVILEGETSADELMQAGVLQVFSFGPALILDGEIAVTAEEEVGRAMVSNPRTAIAMFSPLHYLLLVSDGRTQENEGLSLHQLAEFLKEQGVQLAYNLDGGGSSTMVFMDQVINYPTTNGRRSERAVSDIVYIVSGE